MNALAWSKSLPRCCDAGVGVRHKFKVAGQVSSLEQRLQDAYDAEKMDDDALQDALDRCTAAEKAKKKAEDACIIAEQRA